MTTESLPPENSITGGAKVAATSRMMWIDSDSSACSSVSGRAARLSGVQGCVLALVQGSSGRSR